MFNRPLRELLDGCPNPFGAYRRFGSALSGGRAYQRGNGRNVVEGAGENAFGVLCENPSDSRDGKLHGFLRRTNSLLENAELGEVCRRTTPSTHRQLLLELLCFC
jgi:hypothetical protein